MYIEFDHKALNEHAYNAHRLNKYYDAVETLDRSYHEKNLFENIFVARNDSRHASPNLNKPIVEFIINSTDEEIEQFIANETELSVKAVQYCMLASGTHSVRSVSISKIYFKSVFGELTDSNLKQIFFTISNYDTLEGVRVYLKYLDEIKSDDAVLKVELLEIKRLTEYSIEHTVTDVPDPDRLSLYLSTSHDHFSSSLLNTYCRQEQYEANFAISRTGNFYNWKDLKALTERMDYRFLPTEFAERTLNNLHDYAPEADDDVLAEFLDRRNQVFEILKRIPEDQMHHYTYTLDQAAIFNFSKHLKCRRNHNFFDVIHANGFSNYLKLSKLCHYLEIDPKVMEYFDHSKETGLVSNLNKIGLTIEGVVKSLFKDMSSKCAGNKFLQNLLDPKHFSNIIDYYNNFNTALQSNWLDAYMETEECSPNKSQVSLQAMILPNGVSYLNLFATLTAPGESFINRSYQILLREADTNVAVLIYGWLYKFMGWVDDESTYEEDGFQVVVNNHTIVTKYTYNLANRLLSDTPAGLAGSLPADINVHPKDFFKGYVKMLGMTMIEDLKDPLNLVPFRELPPNISELPSDKWEHMNCASRLITEGNRMSHCVGGEHFINGGEQGDLFFHYDDGSKYGLTIHLPVRYLDDPDHNGHSDNPFSFFIPREDRSSRTFMFDPYIDGKVERLYVLGQIQGKRNTDPGEEVIDEILTTLKSHCSLHDLYEDRKKKNWYIEGDESYALSA